MYGIERKSHIIDRLEKTGSVKVAELSQVLGASKETIRRDLHELSEGGVLKRTHGGAVAGEALVRKSEYPVSIRDIQQAAEKKAICEAAATMVKDGDVMFIDNSSTCRYLPSLLPKDYALTVLTNSFSLILEAAKVGCENHTYISLGGILSRGNLSLHGNMTVKNASDYYPSKAFMSCTGIDAAKGIITDGSINEADTKRLMIDHCDSFILLADHTKWSRNGQVFLSGTEDADAIITEGVNASGIKGVERARITVV